jgi:hypothetical protein
METKWIGDDREKLSDQQRADFAEWNKVMEKYLASQTAEFRKLHPELRIEWRLMVDIRIKHDAPESKSDV